jgi:hypothetical protein
VLGTAVLATLLVGALVKRSAAGTPDDRAGDRIARLERRLAELEARLRKLESPAVLLRGGGPSRLTPPVVVAPSRTGLPPGWSCRQVNGLPSCSGTIGGAPR